MKGKETDRGEHLRARIKELRVRRERRKAANRRPRVRRLTRAMHDEILAKTGGRCHICGGMIEEPMHADHVLAHSGGGAHAAANYLPAHRTCNNYRWDYLPEEFELILKLGVWARTQVEKGTALGREVGERFARYEEQREKRRKVSRR